MGFLDLEPWQKEHVVKNLKPGEAVYIEYTTEELLDNYRKGYNELRDRMNKAIDMLDLIIPELWNINNHMTYKVQDVRRVLKGEEIK